MKTLAIDIETYSSTDLVKSGVYKYVQADDFEIMLFAYSVDDGPVEVVDLAQGETLGDKILFALTSPYVLKTAHNANFERTCITRHFKTTLPVEQWECTMAKASMLGLPLSLDAASKALKLQAEKSAAGKALIKYFSVPCKPTKTNGQRARNLPEHDLQKWNEFKEYCRQDVVVEQGIRSKISFFQIPQTEKRMWQVDQVINDTGILLDPQFVRNAIKQEIVYREKLTKEAIEITGLDNPNSATQLKQWLQANSDMEVESLKKDTIPALLESTNCDTLKRVLNIRQEMSKTSVKKYVAMMNAVCSDSRVRGLLQYYGANRTGRWAGRLVQVQNLPQNHLVDLDLARQLVSSNDLEMLEMLFGNVPDTLSQLIRTAFIAPKGHRFIVADFSAIEARVIAWLAGEKWKLDVFSTHGKIYEAAGAHMFKVPMEQVTKGSTLRHKAKIAELALGYQGGPNALISMGALRMGLVEEELPKLVAMWRQANKKIVQYWNLIGEKAIEAVESGKPVLVSHGIRFFTEKGILFIELPSKRRLSYLRPQLRPSKFGGLALYYEGMNQTTKQWGIQQTYGGKLVENIVQAIARDCLADAILKLTDKDYKIVMHVHDEIVAEMPDGKGSSEEINQIMSEPIPWAKGLPLRADSYETTYYKKD
jgi:DNA polymerase